MTVEVSLANWVLAGLYIALAAFLYRSGWWTTFGWFTVWAVVTGINTFLWRPQSLSKAHYLTAAAILLLRGLAISETFKLATIYMTARERFAVIVLAGAPALFFGWFSFTIPTDTEWAYRGMRHLVEVAYAVFALIVWIYVLLDHKHLDIGRKVAWHGTLLMLYSVNIAGIDFLTPRVFSDAADMSWQQVHALTVPITCAVVASWLIVFARKPVPRTTDGFTAPSVPSA